MITLNPILRFKINFLKALQLIFLGYPSTLLQVSPLDLTYDLLNRFHFITFFRTI